MFHPFALNRPFRGERAPWYPIGSAIPRVIHQTYHRRPWPPEYEANIAAIRAMNPAWEHRFYDYDDRRAFIEAHYGAKVLFAYDAIDPRYGAARADLFRYLLLYRDGGVYLDMKASTSRPLEEVIGDDAYLLSTWRSRPGQLYEGWGRHAELAHRADGEFQQWFIAAVPGHPFLKAVIEQVLANIARYVRGLHGVGAYAVLRVTGPIAYTLAIDPLLALHPHRLVDSKRDLGLIYSIFDEGAGRSHEQRLPHYARQTVPMIRMGGFRRVISGACLVARSALKAGMRTGTKAVDPTWR